MCNQGCDKDLFIGGLYINTIYSQEKLEFTFYHITILLKNSLFTPLTMDQVLNLLGCFICRSRPPQNSHDNQHKMFQSHCKQYLNAFVTSGCSSGKKFFKLFWGLIIFLWHYIDNTNRDRKPWTGYGKIRKVYFLVAMFLKDHYCNIYTN